MTQVYFYTYVVFVASARLLRFPPPVLTSSQDSRRQCKLPIPSPCNHEFSDSAAGTHSQHP